MAKAHAKCSPRKRKWNTRRREESIKNISSLPAEIGLSILDEWILANPPTIKDGILQHPLIDDDWINLHKSAYHDLFHAAPLQIRESLGVCSSPCELSKVDWLGATPEFLKLHDLYCGKAARQSLRFDVRLEVIAEMVCAHSSVIISVENDMRSADVFGKHPRVDAACSGHCWIYAKGMWETWCKDFMDREGISRENTRFEVAFTRDTTLKRQMRWAKEHPVSACGKVFTYAFFGMVFPIVIAGTLVYVTPIWAVFLSRKLHDKIWPKLVMAARKIEMECQRQTGRAYSRLSNKQVQEGFFHGHTLH